MVASNIPSTASQVGGVPSNTQPTAALGTAGDAMGADFVSVFTQLLGAAATEQVTVQVTEQVDDATEIGDASAMATDDVAAQMMVTPAPVIAEIPQAMTNAPSAAGATLARTEANLAASVAVAIAARAQRPAVAAEQSAAAGAQQKGGADASGVLAQAGQLQSALANSSSTSAFSSSANDARDNQSSKHDAGPPTGAVMTLAGQVQTDAPRADLQIASRVGSHAWRDEVAGKLTWMIERGIQHGTLRLSPENLGPLEVRITTQNDQVSVWFGAAHADTRAALENALPRLREMFAAQGLSLADAGVFREPPKDSPHGYTTSQGGVIEGVEERSFTVAVRDGLLDAYA